MKSRREYYETRKILMTGSRLCYSLSFLLFFVCMFISKGFITIAALISILILGGILCSFYAHRQKEFLFCPKCGSKNIVKKAFFGMPYAITEECPDCHKKIDLDKPIDKD